MENGINGIVQYNLAVDNDIDPSMVVMDNGIDPSMDSYSQCLYAILDLQSWEMLCDMTPTPPEELQAIIYHNHAVRRVVVQGLEEDVREVERKN